MDETHRTLEQRVSDLEYNLTTMHEELLQGFQLVKSFLASHQKIHADDIRDNRDAAWKASDVRQANTETIAVLRAELTALIGQNTRRILVIKERP